MLKIDLEDALAAVADARYEDSEEMLANALLKAGVAWLERSRWAEADEALDEAHYLCGRLENWAGLGQVCLRRADAAMGAGQAQQAVAWLDEAAEVFGREEQAREQAQALALSLLERRAAALERLGRDEEALAALEEALGIVAQAGDTVSELFLRQAQAPVLRRLARWDEALAAYHRLGALAQGVNERQRLALAYLGAAHCEAALGRAELAGRAMEAARRVYEDLGQMERARQVGEEMARLGAADPTNEK